MRKIINEIGIKVISPITKSFNEVEIIKIPIIIECIIQKCFIPIFNTLKIERKKKLSQILFLKMFSYIFHFHKKY